MGYTLTKEAIEKIQMRAYEYSALESAGEVSQEWMEKKAALENMEKKNKEVGVSLLESCYCGPENMMKLLVEGGVNVAGFKDNWNVYFALAMDEIVGTSTKMEYDKSKNEFTAKNAVSNGELKYDPKDVELGLWDKICAAFGITTEHAQKVALAKESVKVQKEQLDGLNKTAVINKKNQFMEKHEAFAKQNEEVVNEAEKTEKAFKKLFFGNEDVKDYKFNGGKTLSAVTACIAMYHKSGDKDIANMNTVVLLPKARQHLSTTH